MLLLSSADFFKMDLLEIFFLEYLQSVKQLDPDQAQCFVEPDLAPDCLQRLSAEDTSM